MVKPGGARLSFGKKRCTNFNESLRAFLDETVRYVYKKAQLSKIVCTGDTIYFPKRSRNNLKVKFYSDACFMSEQASQKALKAFLLFKGERYISMHSVAELLIWCGKYDEEFKQILEKGKILDEYYIPTRYPDALPLPAVPYKSYTLDQAKQAVSYAAEIVALVKKN